MVPWAVRVEYVVFSRTALGAMLRSGLAWPESVLRVWKAKLLVNPVEKRLAGKVTPEVLTEEVGHIIGTQRRLATDMWGDD